MKQIVEDAIQLIETKYSSLHPREAKQDFEHLRTIISQALDAEYAEGYTEGEAIFQPRADY